MQHSARLRSLIAALLAAIALSASSEGLAQPSPNWIYMDLGEVLVTGNPTDGYDLVPGALDLLDELRSTGHKLALITNIPEAWGVTCGAKLTMLKDFLQTRLHSDHGQLDLEAVLWPRLDAVILPPFDRYRKPQPFIFVQGLANACPGKALYLGENNAEIESARALGYAAELMTGELPTVAELRARLDAEFSYEHPAQCEFNARLDAVLQQADRGVVRGCVVAP